MAEGGETSIASYAIWIMRVVLPVILFILWYRSQPKGEDGETRYERDELLGARQASGRSSSPPAAIATLLLKEEAYLQKLGVVPAVRAAAPTRRDDKGGGGGGKGGGKRDKGYRDRDAGGKGAKDSGERGYRHSDSMESTAVSALSSEHEHGSLTEEEGMHFESLLNYVAFRFKERPARYFLPDAAKPPPPPPSQSSRRSSGASGAEDAPGAAKANEEAQMVLQGLTNPKVGVKCSSVPKDLFKQLQESHVQPSEATYTLMVEACASAQDVKGASDFIMKMENAGFCPRADLLDKVMELYSSQGGGAKDLAGKLAEAKAPSRGGVAQGSAWPADGLEAQQPSAAKGGSLTGSHFSLRPRTINDSSDRDAGHGGGVSSKKALGSTSPPWAKRPSPVLGPAPARPTPAPRADEWAAFEDDDNF